MASSTLLRVIDIAKELKEKYPILNIIDALKVAAQVNQNEILADGLCTSDLTTPVALEAIAMALKFDIDSYQKARKELDGKPFFTIHGRQSQ